MLIVVVAITLLPRSCSGGGGGVCGVVCVCLWATSAGPDIGRPWPPFPSSIVLPLHSQRLCLELGCCASCRTVPHSQWPLSHLLRGVPSLPSCNSIFLCLKVSRRTCSGPLSLQSPYSKPGIVPRVPFGGGPLW